MGEMNDANYQAAHDRVSLFLRKAGLSPPPDIPILTPLLPPDSQLSQNDLDSARSLLVEQRKASSDYKHPEKKKRNLLRIGKSKDEKNDIEKWVFTKHEVGRAFHFLLATTPLVPVSQAQALLLHASPTFIIDLWYHFHDPKLEKRMSRVLFPRRSSSGEIPGFPWLDWVTGQANLDYIHLLCHSGMEQEVLDRAFRIAFAQNSMQAMEMLLRFGATAPQDSIEDHVKHGNLALVNLLLSAPHAVDIGTWQKCMESELSKEYPTIFLFCIAHRPEVISEDLLLMSLQAGNLFTTAIILAYAPFVFEDFSDIHQEACQLIACIPNHGLRYEFFSLLSMSGFLSNNAVLQAELIRNVQVRHLGLIHLIVNAGVSLDKEPNNAFNLAVSRLDFEILELFRNGAFSSPLSPALHLVPNSTSETDMIRFLDMFGHKELAGTHLNKLLLRAVRNQQVRLIETLLIHGASVEQNDAAPVRTALELADFTILQILLQYRCSPKVLSTVLLLAMCLAPKTARLRALECLTKKGVAPADLGVPLQIAVAEIGEPDSALIRLLLRYKAPIDGVRDIGNNAITVATSRGLVSVLRLLCRAEQSKDPFSAAIPIIDPSKDTLSRAIPIAFNMLHVHGHQVVLDMMTILLENGAGGNSVHKTLLAAVLANSELDIVRLLLHHGADANHRAGACFEAAIKHKSLKMLELLCELCPPSATSTSSILSTTIDPSYFHAHALELLLISTPNIKALLNGVWPSLNLKNNPYLNRIIPCFIRYGLDTNLGDGLLLCFALQEESSILLNQILSANPSIVSLTKAFREVMMLPQRTFQLVAMGLLLDKSNQSEIGQSAALHRETKLALEDDFRGFELLLLYKVDVNFDSGIAIRAAAEAGSMNALTSLLSRNPQPETISLACIAAASSSAMNLNQRKIILEALLDANGGHSAQLMSKMLAKSIKSLPECVQLPELLVARGAQPTLPALQNALKTASESLFSALCRNLSNRNTIHTLFRDTRKSKMECERKYWIYKILLPKGIPKHDISTALRKALCLKPLLDLTIPKIMLDHGAKINEKVLIAAFESSSLEAVILLSKYFKNDKIANLAFKVARESTKMDLKMRFDIYHCFLQWNISEAHVNQAFVENLQSRHPDVAIMGLLLQHGADQNLEGARCFVEAARRGAETEFRTLSAFANTNVELVLESLLSHFKKEEEVVRWFGLCIEEHRLPVTIGQNDLLFKCMRKFPEGNTLLKILLDKGVSPAATVTIRLCPDWEPEVCTALIWALVSSRPRIGNSAISTLISHGKEKALPAFSTQLTNFSAAFACVLDKKRTDVLKTLLKLDRDRIMEHTMRESKFCYLASYPCNNQQDLELLDDASELRLRVASVYTGNFDAFVAMKFEDVPNDGMLHFSAMLALPKFVAWLISRNHDPNLPVAEMGPLIPLSMLCTSRSLPWCKIANEESDWSTRLKKTMGILCPKTRLSWRYSNKTVLHFAFEGGPIVTKAMVECLDLVNYPYPNKDEDFLYVDRDGINFSPDQYIMKVLKVSVEESDALLGILSGCKLMSRYYRDVSPETGRQPPGYHGLPPRLQILWDGSATP